MASRPKRRKRPATRRRPQAAAPAPPRERIVDAFMAELRDRPYAAVSLAAVATAADVPLTELRALYDGKRAIFADFAKRIDAAVLAGGEAEGEGARDRLFGVLMRRLDALTPHKPALRRLARAARRDPGLACVLSRNTARSMEWMLVAAGLRHDGCLGRLAIAGTVLVYADTLSVWLDDDDPSLAKTMAALDRSLERGGRAMALLAEVCDLARPFGRAAAGTKDESAASAKK